MIIKKEDLYKIDLVDFKGETNKQLGVKVVSLGEPITTYSEAYDTEITLKMYSIRRPISLGLYAEFYDETLGRKVFDDENIKDFDFIAYSMLVELSGNGIRTERMEFLTGTAHFASTCAYNLVRKNPPSSLDEIEVILERGEIPYAKYFDQAAFKYVSRLTNDDNKKAVLKMASIYKNQYKVILKSSEPIFNTFMKITQSAALEAAVTR